MLAAREPFAHADSCAEQFAKIGTNYFSPAETARIKKLQKRAMNKRNNYRERDEAEDELLDLAQARLNALGFKTRRQTLYGPEYTGGKERLIRLLESPSDSPIGRVVRRVNDRFELTVAVDPTLEKSLMNTPAYFDGNKNLAIIDLLNLRDRQEVPQDLLHEIRHRYYQMRLQEKVPDIHHGEIFSLKESYHLEKAGGAYDQYLSFEELSTYFRDVQVSLGKFERGEEKLKDVKYNLRDLRRLSQAIVNAVDKIDWAIDPKKVSIDFRKKLIIFPIYEGRAIAKNKVAEVNYPMLQLKTGTPPKEVIAQMQKDFEEVRALAMSRVRFAQEQLDKLADR